MPDIRFANQPFDLAFHPSSSVVYSSLLTGEIVAHRYNDETGEVIGGGKDDGTVASWTSRPSKKCARSVVVDEQGPGHVWAVSKSGGLFGLNPETGAVIAEHAEAHSSPINRICTLLQGQLATGDDDGVIKLWDPRAWGSAKGKEPVREYRHHWEYISDLLFEEERRQLLTTSGDGTVSVIDVRSNKPAPLHVSEDQEDELLSIVALKGGTKHLVGSQLGILTLWDRQRGWADSIDRIPGHPASVETLVALTEDIVATGSEDGLVRVMQVQPNKFLGVIASHGDFPIERIKLDRNRRWLGSVSHDETLKLTDVADLFEDSDDEGEEGGSADEEDSGMEGVEGGGVVAKDLDEPDSDEESDEDDDMGTEAEAEAEAEAEGKDDPAMDEGAQDSDSDDDDAEDRAQARRDRKRQKREDRKEAKKLGLNGKPLLRPKDEVDEEEAKASFFDDL